MIMFNIPRTSFAKVYTHTQEIDYSSLHVAIMRLEFNHEKL